MQKQTLCTNKYRYKLTRAQQRDEGVDANDFDARVRRRSRTLSRSVVSPIYEKQLPIIQSIGFTHLLERAKLIFDENLTRITPIHAERL